MPLISRPCLGEIDYTPEELAFLKAIDRYKAKNHRPHPSWREVLAVIHSLGYRVTKPATALPTFVVRGGPNGGINKCS